MTFFFFSFFPHQTLEKNASISGVNFIVISGEYIPGHMIPYRFRMILFISYLNQYRISVFMCEVLNDWRCFTGVCCHLGLKAFHSIFF